MLTLRITGRVVDVYVNGDQVVSYTVSADFAPTKFDMTTQPDRANVEYLSSEMGLVKIIIRFIKSDKSNTQVTIYNDINKVL